jgi:hypothetical protein
VNTGEPVDGTALAAQAVRYRVWSMIGPASLR